jgi:uncharacterized membrane protein
MVPVIELRGAIPYGTARGLTPLVASCAAAVGNMLPVPFIIIYVRKLFRWMKEKLPRCRTFVERVESRGHGKSGMVVKYGFWGICLLVAIPLPGTGAWTGALVAALLDMRLKKALPAIAMGVVIAATVVGLASAGVSAWLF